MLTLYLLGSYDFLNFGGLNLLFFLEHGTVWTDLQNAQNGGSTAPKEPPKELEKYLKMHKMKIPIQVIKNKMKQNGDSDKIQILEDFLNGGSKAKVAASSTKRKFRKKEEPWELPAGMEPKKEIKPTKKMKPLHWNPVKPKDVKNTVWDGLDESKIQLDATSFEAMFHKKVRAKKEDTVLSPKSSAAAKKVVPNSSYPK